jgi:hypothetical protein
MPLVFPAEIAFVAMIAAFGAFLLLRTETMWLRPLVQALQHPHGAWWKRVVLKPLAVVAAATLYVEKQVRLALSHFASASLHMLTRWFNGLASSIHHTYKELSELAPDWAGAFGHFRHHTMPREINRKVIPVKVAAAHAGALAGRVGARERANNRRLTRGIDRLKRETGLLAGILLGIDILVWGRHARRHHADHARVLPRHERALRNHATRLKRIERALGLGVLAALVYKVLARVAPWLFCRNWKVLGRAVCGMNPNALNSLIGLLLGVFALSDLRRTARIAEDALDLVTGIVWDAAAIGDRPSGRFTID